MASHPTHLRLTFLCALLLGAFLLIAAPAFADDTGVVRGVLSDDAVVQKAVTDATVTIGGIAATVTGQSYEVAGVPLGPQLMVVSAPRHMTLEQTVTVVLGDNTADAALSLTARETYLRYYAAYDHKRFYTAWKMVHPDVRGKLIYLGKPLTYSRYVWYLKTWNLPFVSMHIVSIRTEATWEPRRGSHLKAVYHDLRHITRVIRYKYDRIYTDRCWIHWQNIAGRWYTIFDRPWNCR